ncbi:MAG: peptidoglycan-associated lipoprotein Pal [Pseudomonadota bacterium]
MGTLNSAKFFLPALLCVAVTAACAREEAPVAAPQQDTAPVTRTEPVYQEPVDRVVPGSLQDMIRSAGGDRVFFAFDSSALSADARETLTRQANWLRSYPAVSIRVEGHADERGTREYNLALSSRRAVAVKNYLVALGVSAGRVDTISYGKERPAVLGSGPSVWSKNRRGVTTLTNVSN